MKKQTRTLIIALSVLLVLGGALTFLLLMPAPPQPEDDTSGEIPSLIKEESIPLWDKADSEITKITVTREQEHYTLSKGTDGHLRVEEYSKLPSSAEDVEALTTALSSITASKTVAQSVSDLTAFGLDSPQGMVEVRYADGTVYTGKLGNPVPGGSGFYYQSGDSGAVYVVDTALSDILSLSADQYVGRSIYSAPAVDAADPAAGDKQAQLISAELSYSEGVPVSIRRKSSLDPPSLANFAEYVIAKPYERAANSEVVSAWLTSLNTVVADKVYSVYPTEEDLRQAGLKDPRAAAKLTFAIYDTTDETTEQSVTFTLKVGGQTEDGLAYVMVDGLDVVYLVNPSYIPWADSSYEKMVTPLLPLPMLDSISSFLVTAGGETTRFELTHTEDADESLTVATADGTARSVNEMRTLYQKALAITYQGPAGTETPGEELCKITAVFDQGKEVTAVFQKISINRVLCTIDAGEQYQVGLNTVEDFLAQLAVTAKSAPD